MNWCAKCIHEGDDEHAVLCSICISAGDESPIKPSNFTPRYLESVMPEPKPIEGVGMSADKFGALLDILDDNSVETLKTKNAKYSSEGDCLHNFRKGGDVLGGTPAQACWGYLTKHLVALRDMVQNDDFSDREDFLEKCQDSINYIRFLWCIGNDK